MPSKLVRVSTFVACAILAGNSRVSHTQGGLAPWLDAAKPAFWNKPGQSIPHAPSIQGDNPRCRQLARPAELEADRHLQSRGWRLDGAYQGGWQMLVMRGASSYDGMCRPLKYQVFVFVRGIFVGTLSPTLMNSRTDGALVQVFLQEEGRLTAEYARYGSKDPLCCPSRTTRVMFEIASNSLLLRAVSASTSPNT